MRAHALLLTCLSAIAGCVGQVNDSAGRDVGSDDGLVADGGVTLDPCAAGLCEPIEPCEAPCVGDDAIGQIAEWTADAGAPADAGTAPDAGVLTADFGPTPTCENVDARLRHDFGIIIQPGTLSFGGLASENIGCADRIKVYQMFLRPFRYARYQQRMDPTRTFTMHLYRSASPSIGSCSGYVPSGRAMQIRDLRQCLRVVSGPDDPDFIRIAMFLIHESGHIITSLRPSLKTAFSEARLVERDASCYDRGFLKTYSLRTTNPVSESFAEATALFIGRRKVGIHGTIRDFDEECPHTFAWIRDTVFGMRL